MSVPGKSELIEESQAQHEDESMDTALTCHERIDCSSPEIFQEAIPGASEIRKEFAAFSVTDKAATRFKTELDPEDVKLVNELGQLSADKLMEYVRTLQATALSLGEEEARQFTRAKCLNIFSKQDQN
ncbi:retinal tissue protein [Ditylenchus destructor]|nr:retinal tissue protein [Ditylenchus destructor]